MQKRTIFIGDVHGCREELLELVTALQPTPGRDRLIFVGDLVDKGPDSLGVLRDVKRILNTLPGSVVVSGNHEEKASRFAKKGEYVEPWCEEATEEDWAFIDAMPLTWHDPTLGLRVVHGGVFPALLEKHPDAFQKIEERGNDWRKGGGKVMNRARRMLRVRYVGKDTGDMLALGTNQEGDPFWADVYDGSQGHVVYGHSPWLDGREREHSHATGIDTGCVFGKSLTALVTHADGFRGYVHVEAKQQYAEPFEDEHR